MRALDATGAGKITHVVFIVQENRSFDNLFQGYPGADTVSSGKNSEGQNDHAAARQPQDAVRHRSLRASNVRGLRRHRQAARHRLPDGRLRPRAASFGGPHNGQYVYVPQYGVEAVLRHGARMGARRSDVPVAARRELRRASVRHRGASGVERQLCRPAWGCGGGKGDTVGTITDDRNPYGPRIHAVLRLPDARRRARQARSSRGDSMRARTEAGQRRRSDVVELSGRQAHPLRARLEERHLAELEVHHRRARRQARELHLDHADLRRLRSRRLAAAATDRRGSRRSSTPSARASSGTRRRSS